MRVLFWFILFFVIYKIIRIFSSVSAGPQSEPKVHHTDRYVKQPTFTERDIIDAEYKEIDKDK